jgi:putative MFS transporter
MFDVLDRQSRLSSRQLRLAFIAAWAICLEFLDLFLIGFILTFVAAPWQLNVGQSSIILISSGIGAIIGALYFGRLADRIGRRKVFLITIGVFTLGTAALSVTPDSADFGWIYLVVFRTIIGIGGGGLYVVDLQAGARIGDGNCFCPARFSPWIAPRLVVVRLNWMARDPHGRNCTLLDHTPDAPVDS